MCVCGMKMVWKNADSNQFTSRFCEKWQMCIATNDSKTHIQSIGRVTNQEAFGVRSAYISVPLLNDIHFHDSQ